MTTWLLVLLLASTPRTVYPNENTPVSVRLEIVNTAEGRVIRGAVRGDHGEGARLFSGICVHACMMCSISETCDDGVIAALGKFHDPTAMGCTANQSMFGVSDGETNPVVCGLFRDSSSCSCQRTIRQRGSHRLSCPRSLSALSLATAAFVLPV